MVLSVGPLLLCLGVCLVFLGMESSGRELRLKTEIESWSNSSVLSNYRSHRDEDKWYASPRTQIRVCYSKAVRRLSRTRGHYRG